VRYVRLLLVSHAFAWRIGSGLILLMVSLSSVASLCPTERPRSTEQADYLFQMLTWQLGRQGTIEYEGKYRDARPVPNATLRDFTKIRERELRRSPFDRLPEMRESLYFTLHKKRFKAPEPEVIHIPKQDLWCMVRAGDWVLLSDGSYHHITFVFHVDRQKDRILFLDLWPDQIFLKAGENSMGVAAQVFDYKESGLFDQKGQILKDTSGTWPAQPNAMQVLEYSKSYSSSATKRLVSISRKEYLRVIMGLVTIDTPSFYQYYQQYNKEAASQPEVQLSFALTFLNWSAKRFRLDLLEWTEEPFIEHAVSLSKAAALEQRKNNSKLVTRAACVYDISSLISSYIKLQHGNKAKESNVIKTVKHLRERVITTECASILNSKDYYMLGVAALRAKYINDSIVFLQMAIDKDDKNIEAWLSLATAVGWRRDMQEVISKTSHALKLIEDEKGKVVNHRAKRHRRDDWGRQLDDHQLDVIRWYHTIALGLRAPALSVTNKDDAALQDAKAMIKLRPGLSKGYGLAAHAEISLGIKALTESFEIAGEHLQSANQLTKEFMGKEPDVHVRSKLFTEIKKGAELLINNSAAGKEFFRAYRDAMIKRDRQRAVSLFTDMPLTARVIAEGAIKQGQQAMATYNLDVAIGNFLIALDILELFEDELNVALVLNDLAVTYYLKGTLHEALATARRANFIFAKHDNEVGKGTSLDTLNRIYNGFPDKASLVNFLQVHLGYARKMGFEYEINMTTEDLRRLESIHDNQGVQKEKRSDTDGIPQNSDLDQ
jgi:tetratricopeptide (TPR) repeat protein